MSTVTRDSWHVGRAHFGQFTFTVVVTDGGCEGNYVMLP